MGMGFLSVEITLVEFFDGTCLGVLYNSMYTKNH
jgi:hypothetical protein